MSSIVNIYKGPPAARELEGKAELIEADYQGQGIYLVKCIFLDDPHREIRERVYSVIEQIQHGERISMR